ncbi:hypothetical protein F2Q68_00007715 [Brassica cretica]|uniref:Uncharacterized protein n=1 Tax=Brassica cretica TaxID=69181 RepID=A0A8S9KQW8_BRACR|nr:hypothetical protein F2Q68_00007715 [Brassica cretica]
MEKTRIVRNLEEETVNKEDEKVNEEEEMETPKEKNDSKDESNGEQSNWALVSPDKVDRSPGSHQREDFHISASKFLVLRRKGELRKSPLIKRERIGVKSKGLVLSGNGV